MSTFLPKFLLKNFIEKTSEITDNGTTPEDNKLRIFDRNKEFKYAVIGVDSGPRSITWTPTSAKTINRIFIQNCNFEDFTIKFNSGTDFSPAINVSSNANKNLYFEVADQSVTSVEIEVTNIFGGGVGLACFAEWYIGLELFEVSNLIGSPEAINPIPRVEQSIVRLRDGATQKLFIRNTLDYSMSFTSVPDSERIKFEELNDRNRRETFAFVFRPKTLPDVWDGLGNHYNWDNPLDIFDFTGGLEINGFNVNIDLVQAGDF